MGKRIKRSDRYLIDLQGDEVDRTEEAAGVGYCLVNADGSEVQAFEEQMKYAVTQDANGKPCVAPMVLFHAFMGFQTKNGNVANTVLNDKSDPQNPGTLADAALAIVEHLENVRNGIWVEKTEPTQRAPKYDKDLLAGALLAVLTKSGKAKRTLAEYRAAMDDKSYAAQVRARTDVMAQYYKDLEAKKVETAPVAADAEDPLA